jgi:hypothetical protein
MVRKLASIQQCSHCKKQITQDLETCRGMVERENSSGCNGCRVPPVHLASPLRLASIVIIERTKLTFKPGE